MLFFPLHSPVLKPNLDLTLTKAEHMRDLDPSASVQVMVEMKFLF